MFSPGRSSLPSQFIVVPAFLAFLFLSSGFLSAQDEDLKALFREGRDEFGKCNYEAALQKFQEILAQNPSNELAFYFWEEAGNKIFLDMLIKEGEYEKVARRFIDLARVGRREKQNDESRIRELVGMVVSSDPRLRHDGLLELASNHGEFAVPHLYRQLGNEDVEVRVNAIAALIRMGETVTLPLIQVLRSDNEQIKRNTAVILGKIKDERSIPALKNIYDAGASDELTKNAAVDALFKITGREIAGIEDAAILFTETAEAYLKGDDHVCKPFLSSRVVWKWQNGDLVHVPATPGLRSLELAEDACYGALECDVGSVKAISLLAVVYASQIAEIKNTPASEDEDDAMTFARQNMGKAATILALCGPDRLGEALAFALDNNLGLAAIEIIGILDETSAFDDFTLDQAFRSEDKLVRYAAAFAAVRGGLIDEDIVRVVARALGETSVRQVLIIDNNSETRNALTTGLNNAGYFAINATGGAEGLSRAKDFPPKDLVIAQAGLTDLTIDSIVFEMSSGGSARTPVVLLAADESMDGVRNLWEGKVAGFLTTSEVINDAYLPTVESAVNEVNEARRKALEISIKAAQALSVLDRNLLSGVVEDLVQSLGKPDEVKIPALRALAKAQDSTSYERIARLFGDTSASAAVRTEAAKALGEIFITGKVVPDTDTLSTLREALADSDSGLRLAAGEAFGKAVGLSDDELKEILISNRIQ